MASHTNPGQGFATKPVLFCAAIVFIGVFITLLWVAHYRQPVTLAPARSHHNLSQPNNDTAATLVNQLNQETHHAREGRDFHPHKKMKTHTTTPAPLPVDPLPGANASMTVVNNYPGPAPWKSTAETVSEKTASNHPSHTLRDNPFALHHTLEPGTLIPVRLVTGTRGETPGPLVATVATTLYDSATGSTCLIPAGATLMGEVIKTVNDATIETHWSQLVVNHTTIALPTNTTMDREGAPGLGATIQRHTLAHLGQSLWQTAVNNAPALIAPLTSAPHTAQSNAYPFYPSNDHHTRWQAPVTQTLQAVNQSIMHDASVSTTLTAPAGLPFYIVLTAPLTLPQPCAHSGL